MQEFEYLKASSITDALDMFNKSNEPSYLAGGHTILPTMKQNLAAPSHLIDISSIPELKSITVDDKYVTIGAGTVHADVADSKAIQEAIIGLSILASGIGDPQVRARGTIGGSLANSDPAADYPAAVLALKATIITNEREIHCSDFFTELFETALNEGELITGVRFSIPLKSSYMKFPNPASRYAIVGVMYSEFNDGPCVAVTGAGPFAFRSTEIEEALISGKEIPTITSTDFNSDIHASSEYRAHLVSVMAKRAIESAS